MPFKGRVKKPKSTKHECRKPWYTWLIRQRTVWVCSKCQAAYVLIRDDSIEERVWMDFDQWLTEQP
jgi:hypothetical protein